MAGETTGATRCSPYAISVESARSGVRRSLVAASFCLLILATGSASSATGTGPHRDHGRGHWFKHSCAAAPTGFASCDAQVVTNAAGSPLAGSAPPAGALGPAQFASAYSLPTSAPSTATIAIVDAYDDPNIESDLAAFDGYYGLPACTTANGCFRKVNQVGGTSYPSRNTGWGLEIALDVETAHEICQSCKILLVEAISPSYSNLGAAENEAVLLGASVVSNSWGGAESSTESSLDTYFNHPGVVITASAGDSGYGAQYPAASPYVVAVGGTSLSLNADNSYKSEHGLDRHGLRMLRVRVEAVLAGRLRLREAHDRRRLGRRRPQQRRRGLRHVRLLRAGSRSAAPRSPRR